MIQEYLTVSIYSIYSAQSNKEESLPRINYLVFMATQPEGILETLH